MGKFLPAFPGPGKFLERVRGPDLAVSWMQRCKPGSPAPLWEGWAARF